MKKLLVTFVSLGCIGLLFWHVLALEQEELPLHIAVQTDNLEVANTLLAKGIDVYVRDPRISSTPLHWAAVNGYTAIVELLIAKGAMIEVQDSHHAVTPLHYGTLTGQKAVVELLLNKGATIEAKDTDGQTPLHYAAGGADYYLDVLNRITSDKLGKSLFQQAPLSINMEGRKEIVELLLNKGANPSITANDGNTPLHEAACNGNHDIMKFLLDRGAKINLQNTEGLTPLHRAERCWASQETLTLLRQYGAKE